MRAFRKVIHRNQLPVGYVLGVVTATLLLQVALIAKEFWK